MLNIQQSNKPFIMKKTTLRILSIGVITALVSAFSNKKSFAEYTFFRKSGACRSNSRIDYVYDANGSCNVHPDCICKGVWEQLTVPSNCDHPSATSTFISSTDGDYQPFDCNE